MRFKNVFIPYGAYWSSPFCRWQGILSGEHPLKLASQSTLGLFEKIKFDSRRLAGIHFGMTVPQLQSFYSAPWLGALIGADHVTGPTISQACATSARVLASAATQIELNSGSINLAIATDKTSNGPHIYYPDPSKPGGTGITENWVLDNFNNDPNAKVAMVNTAENIASRFNISREAQDELTLCRYEQYQSALENDRSFQKKYMSEITIYSGKHPQLISKDEGIHQTTAAGVAALAPVLEGGTVTYATQTHPADGNAGVLLCSVDEIATLQPGNNVKVQLLSFGEGRSEKAYMGMAPLPAAQAALSAVGLNINDISAIKTHNPFAVNDLYFASQTGVRAEDINNFGSSLIFGHPQAPTGLRLIIELIEELVLNGGGYGLFTGCAAGDTAAAIVLKVDER